MADSIYSGLLRMSDLITMQLGARLEEAKNVLRYLRPELLDEIAVYYDPATEIDE